MDYEDVENEDEIKEEKRIKKEKEMEKEKAETERIEEEEIARTKFTRKKKSIDIVIEDNNGEEEKCTIRQLDGKARGIYLDSIKERTIINERREVIGMRSLKRLESSLLKFSLYHEDGKLFSEKELDEFPSQELETLFKKSLRFNALDEKGIKQAKND